MQRTKLKHSKFKNTGILFELLVRQITADILEKKEESHAKNLLLKFFKEESALGREKKLYDCILNEKSVKTQSQSEKFLELVIRERKRISNKELAEQKFNLIKEIKNTYPMSDFFRSSLPNYRELASIYKIFEEETAEVSCDPREILQARNHILEHVISKSGSVKVEKTDREELLETFTSEDKHVKLLTLKMLFNSFNKKYADLNKNQKGLLKEYVNNVANTNSLKTYINNQVVGVKKELNEFKSKIKDSVTLIKLKETITQLDKITEGKLVKDNHIMALLFSYELLEELKRVTENE